MSGRRLKDGAEGDGGGKDDGGDAAKDEEPSAALSAEDLAEYRTVFKMFDRDGDQTIDLSELGKAMEELGQDCPPEELAEMIGSVDKDGTGAIDFEEFVQLMQRKREGDDEAQDEEKADADAQEERESDEGPAEELPPQADQAVRILTELMARLEAEPLPPEPDEPEEGDEPSPKRIEPISVRDAVAEAARRNLLHPVPPPNYPPRAVDCTVEQLEALAVPELVAYLDMVCTTWRQILSEEEDWMEVHCEDDDPTQGRLEKRDEPSDADIARMEQDLRGFQFQKTQDPKLAVGREAFELAARSFPFFMFPIASVVPRLTDEEITAGYGLLDLSGQALRDKGAVALAEVIRRDALRRKRGPADGGLRSEPLIWHLELQGNYISPAGGVALIEALCARDEDGKGTLVHHLDLSDNQLGHKAAHLPRGSAQMREMRGLLRARALQAMSPPKKDAPRPEPVPDMAHESWGEARGSGRVIRTLLDGGPQAPKHLQVLRLRKNKLGDSDVQWIAQGLHDNGLLSELDLSCNNLGVASARSLATMLEQNSSLKILKVAWNKFGGAVGNKDLPADPPATRNKVEQSGTDHLLQHGICQSNLEEFDMSFTGITDPPFKQEKDKGTDKKKAAPSEVPPPLYDGGGILVAKAIAAGYFRRINVSGNKIGVNGALKIAASIRSNKYLSTLILSHNPLGSVGVKAIVETLVDQQGNTLNNTLVDLEMISTLAGPPVEDKDKKKPGPLNTWDIDDQCDESAKKLAAKPPDPQREPSRRWRDSEFYRPNCSLYCTQCETTGGPVTEHRPVRCVLCHDRAVEVARERGYKDQHRLGDRKPGALPTVVTQIERLQCGACGRVVPCWTFCKHCGIPFTDWQIEQLRCGLCGWVQSYGTECKQCGNSFSDECVVSGGTCTYTEQGDTRRPMPRAGAPGAAERFLADTPANSEQWVEPLFKKIDDRAAEAAGAALNAVNAKGKPGGKKPGGKAKKK